MALRDLALEPTLLSRDDAARLGVTTGDLLKVVTAIGHFVDKVWVTGGVRPGVIACSHHLDRWNWWVPAPITRLGFRRRATRERG